MMPAETSEPAAAPGSDSTGDAQYEKPVREGRLFFVARPGRGGFGNCVVYYNMLYRGFGFFYLITADPGQATPY